MLKTVYFKEKYLSNKECEQIINLSKEIKDKDASFYFNDKKNKYRSSKVKFLIKNRKFRFIYKKLITDIKKINKRYFGFNLTEISNIQLSKYSYLDKGQYKTHQDVIWLKQKHHRKLTIIIQLSENHEYTGGNLCIDGLSKKHLKKKGTLIVFPSFFYHSVERVLSGERLSLVAWFSGKLWK